MPIAPAESTVKVWRVVGVTVLRPIVGPRSSPATSDGPNECVGGLSAISGPSKSKRELAPSLLFEVEMFTTQKSIALRWGDNAHTGAFLQPRARNSAVSDPNADVLCYAEIEHDRDQVKMSTKAPCRPKMRTVAHHPWGIESGTVSNTGLELLGRNPTFWPAESSLPCGRSCSGVRLRPEATA